MTTYTYKPRNHYTVHIGYTMFEHMLSFKHTDVIIDPISSSLFGILKPYHLNTYLLVYISCTPSCIECKTQSLQTL